jgi:hypothetical protein
MRRATRAPRCAADRPRGGDEHRCRQRGIRKRQSRGRRRPFDFRVIQCPSPARNDRWDSRCSRTPLRRACPGSHRTRPQLARRCRDLVPRCRCAPGWCRSPRAGRKGPRRTRRPTSGRTGSRSCADPRRPLPRSRNTGARRHRGTRTPAPAVGDHRTRCSRTAQWAGPPETATRELRSGCWR